MLIRKNKIPIKEIIIYGFLPSFLKKLVYKLKGYKVGKNVTIGLGSVVIGKNVSIGDGSSIGFMTVIDARTIRIGRFVKIGSLTMINTEEFEVGDDTRINEFVIIGGMKTPESRLSIGKRAIIMEYSYINTTKPIRIGDDTGIGGHCLLFTHGSWLSQLEGFPVDFSPIIIGKKVWLPWRVFIMPGVTIGDEVVIGANSLVSKDLPSNVLAVGSPAKILVEDYPKPISQEKRNAILENIFSDFMNYLEYHGFSITISNTNGATLYAIKKNSKVSELLYGKRAIEPHFTHKDNLLVIDGDYSIEENKVIKMWVNLKNNQRFGSSKVGEEFVRFLSRYGVRFDRLD